MPNFLSIGLPNLVTLHKAIYKRYSAIYLCDCKA